MSVFISDKDTTKLYVQSFRPEWADSYIRDFEAIQKTHSHVLSCVKTLGFALSIQTWMTCLFFKQYVFVLLSQNVLT